MNVRHEFEMRLPVARWMLLRGLSPVCEVGSLNNCDMVGVRFAEKPVRLVEMVAVELKRQDVAGVLRQCTTHQIYGVTEVWAAMWPEVARRNIDRFAVEGIGLLAVTTDTLTEVLAAKRVEGRDLSRWAPAMRRRRREYEWRMSNHNMLRRTTAGVSK